MEYFAGLVFSFAIASSANFIGFDRDRSFYPTVLMAIALVYVLFAVIGASTQALLAESLVALAYFAVAVISFKVNLWLVVVALFVHGMFDLGHHFFIYNSTAPEWWPGFCMAFDLFAGVYLAVLLVTRPGFHISRSPL